MIRRSARKRLAWLINYKGQFTLGNEDQHHIDLDWAGDEPITGDVWIADDEEDTAGNTLRVLSFDRNYDWNDTLNRVFDELESRGISVDHVENLVPDDEDDFDEFDDSVSKVAAPYWTPKVVLEQTVRDQLKEQVTSIASLMNCTVIYNFSGYQSPELLVTKNGTATIHTWPILDEVSYFAALHELGHLEFTLLHFKVNPNLQYDFQSPETGQSQEEELYAWHYAIEHAQIPLSKDTLEEAGRAFRTYQWLPTKSPANPNWIQSKTATTIKDVDYPVIGHGGMNDEGVRPILYDPSSDTLYRGPEWSSHWELIMNLWPKEFGQDAGDLEDEYANGELDKLNSLGYGHYYGGSIDWLDGPEPREYPKLSSAIRFENVDSAGYGTPGYTWENGRLGFFYIPSQNTVYLGSPGNHHYELMTALYEDKKIDGEEYEKYMGGYVDWVIGYVIEKPTEPDVKSYNRQGVHYWGDITPPELVEAFKQQFPDLPQYDNLDKRIAAKTAATVVVVPVPGWDTAHRDPIPAIYIADTKTLYVSDRHGRHYELVAELMHLYPEIARGAADDILNSSIAIEIDTYDDGSCDAEIQSAHRFTETDTNSNLPDLIEGLRQAFPTVETIYNYNNGLQKGEVVWSNKTKTATQVVNVPKVEEDGVYDRTTRQPFIYDNSKDILYIGPFGSHHFEVLHTQFDWNDEEQEQEAMELAETGEAFGDNYGIILPDKKLIYYFGEPDLYPHMRKALLQLYPGYTEETQDEGYMPLNELKSSKVVNIQLDDAFDRHRYDPQRRTYIYDKDTDTLYLSSDNAYHTDLYGHIYAPDYNYPYESYHGFVDTTDHVIESYDHPLPLHIVQQLEEQFGHLEEKPFVFPVDWRYVIDQPEPDDSDLPPTQQWPEDARQSSTWLALLIHDGKKYIAADHMHCIEKIFADHSLEWDDSVEANTLLKDIEDHGEFADINSETKEIRWDKDRRSSAASIPQRGRWIYDPDNDTLYVSNKFATSHYALMYLIHQQSGKELLSGYPAGDYILSEFGYRPDVVQTYDHDRPSGDIVRAKLLSGDVINLDDPDVLFGRKPSKTAGAVKVIRINSAEYGSPHSMWENMREAFIYDPQTNTVYIGSPGYHHFDLVQAIKPNEELDRSDALWSVDSGVIISAADTYQGIHYWFDEVPDAVVHALKAEYPTLPQYSYDGMAMDAAKTAALEEIRSPGWPSRWAWYTSWIYIPQTDELLIKKEQHVNHSGLLRDNEDLLNKIYDGELGIMPGLILESFAGQEDKYGVYFMYSDKFEGRDLLDNSLGVQQRAMAKIQEWANANTDWGQLEVIPHQPRWSKSATTLKEIDTGEGEHFDSPNQGRPLFYVPVLDTLFVGAPGNHHFVMFNQIEKEYNLSYFEPVEAAEILPDGSIEPRTNWGEEEWSELLHQFNIPHVGKAESDGDYDDWDRTSKTSTNKLDGWIYDPSTGQLYTGGWHGRILMGIPGGADKVESLVYGWFNRARLDPVAIYSDNYKTFHHPLR
jgi:hypothetical protein